MGFFPEVIWGPIGVVLFLKEDEAVMFMTFSKASFIC